MGLRIVDRGAAARRIELEIMVQQSLADEARRLFRLGPEGELDLSPMFLAKAQDVKLKYDTEHEIDALANRAQDAIRSGAHGLTLQSSVDMQKLLDLLEP